MTPQTAERCKDSEGHPCDCGDATRCGSKADDPATFQGYHTWQHDETNTAGEVVGQTPCGSFEVFWYDAMAAGDTKDREGWYWWACFPGCLPDGEPSGPFPTAEGAYLDAIGGLTCNT